MARLLLGVTGGIAAYKALEVVRLAMAAGHAVRVVQTPASERFVGRASFEAITGAPVLTSTFDADPLRGAFPGDERPGHEPINHLGLVEAADVYLVAPASANTIAKLAHGFADGMLTTAALAADCPVIVAPAMNARMWEHPATRANVDRLTARGVTVLDPGEGSLASRGEHGVGRLPEPPALLAACEAALAGPGADTGGRSLAGMHVLVTAGGTREPIDAVRFIGNRSSGRMGLALARVAADRGARVTLIAANVPGTAPAAVERVDVTTASELAAACARHFPSSDVLVMAAAVADYRPQDAQDGKLERRAGERLVLELEPTDDVVAALAASRRPEQTIVGFAAEHGTAGLDRGRAKLERKGLDAIVVNDISRSDIGFEADANEVTIVTHDGERPVARAPKERIAAAILDAVAQLRERAPGPAPAATRR